MTAPDIRTPYVTALRTIADMLEANPDVRLPYEGTVAALTIYCHNSAEVVAAVVAVRSLGVPLSEQVDPHEQSYGYKLRAQIGGGFRLDVLADLPNAAERTVLGSKTVEDVSWRTPLGADIPGGAS